MSTKRLVHRRNWGRRRFCAVEMLEKRALLAAASETFNGPSLAHLIQLAHEGENTAPAAIHTMVQALQTQMDNGPLADLKAGTVTGPDFVTEVQNLETSYEQNVDQQLSPEFPNVDKILKLQGQRVVADVTSLNHQNAVGLISNAQFITSSQAAIDSLTSGPLLPLHTPLSAYADRTTAFETDLHTLVQSLGTTATPALTLTQVNNTLQAEAKAYQAAIDGSLSVTHPTVAGMVDTAVTTLENTSSSIAQSGATDAQAQTQLNAAITAFDTAVLDTNGVFGPSGVVAQSLSHDHDSDHDSD